MEPRHLPWLIITSSGWWYELQQKQWNDYGLESLAHSSQMMLFRFTSNQIVGEEGGAAGKAEAIADGLDSSIIAVGWFSFGKDRWKISIVFDNRETVMREKSALGYLFCFVFPLSPSESSLFSLLEMTESLEDYGPEDNPNPNFWQQHGTPTHPVAVFPFLWAAWGGRIRRNSCSFAYLMGIP